MTYVTDNKEHINGAAALEKPRASDKEAELHVSRI